MIQRFINLITQVIRWGLKMARKNWSNERVNDFDLNDNFKATEIQEVYTGTGFNVTNNTTNSSASGVHTLNFIDAGSIGNADYLQVDIRAAHNLQVVWSGTPGPCSTQLKVETRHSGGTFTATSSNDVHRFGHAQGTLYQGGAGLRPEIINNKMYNHSVLHTLTGSEKSLGMEVQVVAVGTVGTGGSSAQVLNSQTVVSTRF